MRDALVLATSDVFDALRGTLPPDAQVHYVEAHLVAAALYGDPAAAAAGVTNRRNVLRKRVNLSTLAPRALRRPSSAPSNRPVSRPPSTDPSPPKGAAELTVAGIELIAYENGWPNPDSGTAQLRSGLGLPPLR